MKKYAFKYCFCLLFTVFIVFSCKKESNEIKTPELVEEVQQIQEVAEAKIVQPEQTELNPLDSIDSSDYLNVQKTTAHQKYLSENLNFTDLPEFQTNAEKTAVVGTEDCLFYEIESVSSSADLKKLPKGEVIPFASIIPIYFECRCSDAGEWDNEMFHYLDNYNYFYQTEFNGKKGLVFGANLTGLNDSTEKNIITSSLYKNQGKSDVFYPYLGYKNLDQKIQTKLVDQRIAFEKVSSDEYHLNLERPDDMISLYMNHQPQSWEIYQTVENRGVPIFVTTDLIAHSQHLIFDKLLQNVEEKHFFPKLSKLCESFIEKLSAMNESIIDNAENISKESNVNNANDFVHISMQETISKALLYFQTAHALASLAPHESVARNDWGETQIIEVSPDAEEILKNYPQEVRDEIALMQNAGGFEQSKVFTFADGIAMQEDYSQYKPRGHYTKNGRLEAYFNMMMWFGRVHFPIADASSLPNELVAGTQLSETELLSLKMLPIALLINDLVLNDKNLAKEWQLLFEPITALIGKSDDLSFFETLPLWKEYSAGEKIEKITDPNYILTYAKKAIETFAPPAISGTSVFLTPSEVDGINRSVPMGWRLFGQRFTLDSWVHENVSPPKLLERDMVSGLDIMKVFGSQTAELLFSQNEYKTVPALKENLDVFESFFEKQDSSFWNSTYYNQVLLETALQAKFETGSGFYFTENPVWGIKSLLSAHGTWAELRHDTLLYVKQVYAEKGGDGDMEPTFRTKDVPKPVHYIEPNIAFFEAAHSSIENLWQIAQTFFAEDEELLERVDFVLTGFGSLLERATAIVAKEVNDQEVSLEDVEWIATIPSELARYVVAFDDAFGYCDNTDLFKMAVIADIYTNAETGYVLETAVGIPYRIYVALNDGQGGKRIAVGYTFSYYEFPWEMTDRLTDEKWRQAVYSGEDLTDYLPFWSKNIAD